MHKNSHGEDMETFVQAAVDTIKEAVKKTFDGNASKAAKNLGVNEQTLYCWLKGTRKPSLSKLSPLLGKLGAKIVLPDKEISKDVCFVDARISEAGTHLAPPEAIDYTAAPLVGEVGAGAGYLPQEEIKNWFLVYRHLPAVRARKNLIAVQLGKGSDSMLPTLKPEDIVLVDRDDSDVSRPGHMMLVKDPLDGSGMIKRVSVQEKDEDFTITFYSDNAAKYPPSMYSLWKDFHGEWGEAIIGRVIWAWQDMRDK